MAESFSKEYDQKVKELSAVIQAIKLRLIAKYGLEVEAYWQKEN